MESKEGIRCLTHRLHLIFTDALGFRLKLPVVGLEEAVVDNEFESAEKEEDSLDFLLANYICIFLPDVFTYHLVRVLKTI